MNKQDSQNQFSLQSIHGVYQLNGVILSKEELCVYFEFLGFQAPRCLSDLKFRFTVFQTLENLDYEEISDSLEIYSANKTAIARILVERRAFLDGTSTLYHTLLENKDDFLAYFSRN